MSPRDLVAAVAIVGALVASGFLMHTLRHLSKLEITVTHPRVLVETALTLGLGAVASALLARGRADKSTAEPEGSSWSS